MAKSSTRRVNIYINGQEVEASVKQIRAEMNKLVNEQNRMVIGSDEYVAHAKRIKELRGYLKEHAQNIGSAASAWSEMYNKVLQFGTGIGGLTQILSSLDNVTSTLKQVATDLAAMDDVYSDVIKTTGLSREEVEELNESFKNLDTRTSREQLNNLAYIAGKLGISTKETVQQFVEAADIINVSMGDVLGDDATLAVGKMVDVYKKSTDMLKDKSLKEQLLSLGSAVNELGKTSTANEQYMVNFTGRLGGIAVQAGLAADQILGYASALDQDMQKVEMSATAFQKLIQKVISKPAEFAKVAGMEISQFKNLIETDMNEALKKVLKGFSGAGGFDKLLPVFQDLGLDGARAAAAISSMANSLDKVEAAQQVANSAMLEGVSCYEEFSVKNNNMQASLEKARKKFQDTRLELGEKLYPILLKLTKTSTAGIKAISTATTWISKNKGVVLAIIAPLTAYIAKVTLLKTRMLLLNAAEKAGIVIKAAYKTAVYAVAAAQAKLAGNTDRAAAAVRKMSASANAVPWVALATAIVAAGTAIYKLATRSTAAEKAMKDFHERTAEQKVEADRLFGALRDLRKGSDEYNKVQKKIIETYPTLLKDQLDEKGNIIDIEQAYSKVITAMKRKIALDIQQEQITETMKKEMDRLAPSLKHLSPEIGNKTVELAEGGMDANAIVRGINRYLLKDRKLSGDEEFWVRNITKIVEEEQAKIEQIKQNLAPWIGDQLDAVIADIEEETDPGAGSGADGGGGETAEEVAKKKLTEWEKLQNEVKKLFQKDELVGLDKVAADKEKVRQEYTDLIERIEAYTDSKGQAAKDLADQVRKYMANAIGGIDSAARTEKMKKTKEQYEKLCGQFRTLKEKLDQGITDSYSSQLLQAEQKWKSTIEEIDKSIAYYEAKSKEEYDPDKGTGLSEDELALLDKLLEQKRQAIALEAQEELSIVKRAETDISEALMTEAEKRIAAVRKEYQARISAAQSAIAKLKALGGQENQDRIKQLEEQIKALKEKLAKEVSDIEKTDGKSKATTGIGKLLDIDWKNFKKGWEKNLSEIADVIQDFASTATQIFESVNQIQSNKEKAMLNAYKKGYDERKEKLDWQLEQGIISQEYYNAQVAQLDEELEAKEKEMEIAQFRREKKAAIAEAIISGIVSAVKSLENGGGYPWGLVSMALSLATTAIQVAAIESQPEPYARGGYVEREKNIVAGERGREWIAPNELVRDPETKPVIDALEQYRKGDKSPLRNLQMAVPDEHAVSQAATAISRTFAPERTEKPTADHVRTAAHTGGEAMDRMLEELTALRRYMSDPKNRQAVLSRELQLEFESQEQFLRNAASLKR
ncbi:MAG: phage tail tape measure protein [Bacteroidales bacterium]|nr:phage tail tape measure protein [Bacteroidales bacterium]